MLIHFFFGYGNFIYSAHGKHGKLAIFAVSQNFFCFLQNCFLNNYNPVCFFRFLSILLNWIGCHGNIKGILAPRIFFSTAMRGISWYLPHIYNIQVHIHCVYDSSDMSAFVAMETLS